MESPLHMTPFHKCWDRERLVPDETTGKRAHEMNKSQLNQWEKLKREQKVSVSVLHATAVYLAQSQTIYFFYQCPLIHTHTHTHTHTHRPYSSSVPMYEPVSSHSVPHQ